MRENLRKFWLLLIIILIISLILPFPVFAQSESDLTAVEQWVLGRIAAGEEADLNDHDLKIQFPDEADRVLSSDLFKKLLEDPSTPIPRNGIRIRNAVVNDPLDFGYIEVKHVVSLENCRFEDDLNFSESHFTHNLSFIGSTFISSVHLFGAQIDETLFVGNAIFENSTDFSYANLAGNFRVIGAHFNGKEQKANFNHMVVGGDVILRGASFAGPVDFSFADIGNSFAADGAQFNYRGDLLDGNGEQIVNHFDSMKVGTTLFLRNATFEGPLDFRYTEAGTNFTASAAHFNYAEGFAYFGEMTVGDFIFLNRTTFAGPVDFRFAQVGRNFEAKDAQFNNKEKTAYFGNMKVGVSVLMQGATFRGPVDFRYIEVDNNFEANGAQFNYDGTLYDDNGNLIVNRFGPMKIGDSAFFNPILVNRNVKPVIFVGPVDFNRLDVGQSFEAQEAQFKSTRTAFFGHVKVGAMLLNTTTFAGPVDFRYTQVETNFEASGAIFNAAQWNYFTHMKVGDTMLFDQAFYQQPSFAGPVSFANSQIGIFQMENADLHSFVDITGMKYDSILFKKAGGSGDWNDLVWLLNQSPYDAQTYKTLESFFANQGRREIADQVFFAYKERERSSFERSFWGFLQRLWNWSFGAFIRYGRRPIRAFVGSLGFILFGTFIFWKKENMIETSKKDRSESENGKPAEKARPYYPLLYSLDLFLGPVDLGVEKQWEPRPERKAIYFYSIFHRLVGWIFITIALLAVTGIAK